MRRVLPSLSLAAVVLACSAVGRAAPILASPGDPAFDAPLASLAGAYQLQQDVFATRETGICLDVFALPAEIPTIKGFFAQTATSDFQQATGKHPYEVVSSFEEYGDEGNFAGVASVGVAARLLVLRATNAPADELGRARDAAIRAAHAWHVYGAIGGPGVVARGVRRSKPLVASDPPLPGVVPATTPLFDAGGQPLPTMKDGAWRAPVVPGFDGWIWLDDTSKDQVSGYALAAAWLWDALKDDPMTPPGLLDSIATDLTAFAKALMKISPEYKIDLCIRDADGRLTGAHDLNPRQVFPNAVLPASSTFQNGFNAAMAMAVIGAAYHVGGDPVVGDYYYKDLVALRDFPSLMLSDSGVVFMGTSTNYSNANMLAISLASIGRFETDPYVRGKLQSTLDTQFWSTGDDRDASHAKQGWFDAVMGSYAKSPPKEIRQRVAENLLGFKQPPAFERDRINCDDAEIKAGVCLAIDGMTMIKLAKGLGHGGGVEAQDIVPMALRPDSDFEWRSDPHDVNGMGSNMIDPGGDFRAAYWLSRLSDLDDTTKNVTNHPRMPVPYELGGPEEQPEMDIDAGVAGAGGQGGAAGGTAGGTGGTGGVGTGGKGGVAAAAPAPASGSGCGCRTVRGENGSFGFLAIVLGLGALRFRRRRASVVPVAASLLALGCGNGSGASLGQTGASAAGGAGGSGTGSAGAAGTGGSPAAAGAPGVAGSGGVAGASAGGACAGKIVASPSIFVGAPGAIILSRPKLVVTAAGRVHLLANGAFVQPEGPTPIVRTSFDSSAAWPPSVVPLADTGLLLWPSARAVSAAAQGDGLLVASATSTSPEGGFFVQSLGADGKAAGPPLGVVLAPGGYQVDDLLAQPEGALVAYTAPAGLHWVESVVSVSKGGVSPVDQPSAGCSTQATLGALARSGATNYLAVIASPLSPPDGCDGPPGMAAGLLKLGGSGATPITGALDEGANPMTLLAASTDTDLWVLSEFMGGGEDPPPMPAHLTRLDGDGSILAQQPMLPDGGIVTGSISIAPLGKNVAVSAVRSVDGVLHFGVRIYDPSLAMIGDVVLGEPPGSDGTHLGGTRASMVSSGGALFVVWETNVSGAPGFAVTRVDCLP